MKKFFIVLIVLFSFKVFSQDCDIETGECGGDIVATPTESLQECDLSDPDCPMPQEIISNEKINQ